VAFDFPASPTPGTAFTPTGGPTYVWGGVAWVVADTPSFRTATGRNRIVNPAFTVSQENGSNAGGPSSALNFFAADQWLHVSGVAPGTVAAQRTAGAPDGGPYFTHFVCQAAKGTLGANDAVQIMQAIEGLRVADFGWGTAQPKQVVLRFWAKTSPAGTWSVFLQNFDGSRSYLASFITATAGVWQQFTLVIPGDTTGTWKIDNTVGIQLGFVLAMGSTYTGVAGWQAGAKNALSIQTNGMATVGNYLQLASVGLYLDPDKTGIAPPFEMPDYSAEQLVCRRYWTGQTSNGQVPVAGYLITPIYLPVPMRVQPAVGNLSPGSVSNATAIVVTVTPDCQSGYLQFNGATGNAYVLGRLDAFSARM